jgi:hypothetical protein
MLLYDGLHYDALVLVYPGAPRDMDVTVFPAVGGAAEAAERKARAVVGQAHAARQFTDTANFALRCLVCQLGLKAGRVRSRAVWGFILYHTRSLLFGGFHCQGSGPLPSRWMSTLDTRRSTLHTRYSILDTRHSALRAPHFFTLHAPRRSTLHVYPHVRLWRLRTAWLFPERYAD